MTIKLTPKAKFSLKWTSKIFGVVVFLGIIISIFSTISTCSKNKQIEKSRTTDFQEIQQREIDTSDDVMSKCESYEKHPFYNRIEYVDLKKACKLARYLAHEDHHKILVEKVSGFERSDHPYRVSIYSASMGSSQAVVYGSRKGLATFKIGDEDWSTLICKLDESIRIDVIEYDGCKETVIEKKYSSIFSLRDLIRNQIYPLAEREDQLKEEVPSGKLNIKVRLKNFDSKDWDAFDKYFN